MTEDEIAEGVAARVLELLNGRPLAWLARKAGIHYNTLHSQLKTRPRKLSTARAFLIADALDVTIADLDPRTTDIAA